MAEYEDLTPEEREVVGRAIYEELDADQQAVVNAADKLAEAYEIGLDQAVALMELANMADPADYGDTVMQLAEALTDESVSPDDFTALAKSVAELEEPDDPDILNTEPAEVEPEVTEPVEVEQKVIKPQRQAGSLDEAMDSMMSDVREAAAQRSMAAADEELYGDGPPGSIDEASNELAFDMQDAALQRRNS